MTTQQTIPERQTVAAFARKHGITLGVEWTDHNPHMEMTKNWAQTARHFKVTLRRLEGRRLRKLTTYFSQGSAHTKEPTVEDVLDTLASDASTLENARSFEEWARELGFDEDSRKAEKTFKVVERQSARLKRFLGDGYFGELLWDTERL